MKNNVGWTSEFRRKKFEKRYQKDREPRPFRSLDMLPTKTLPSLSKTIAVMLDIEGTCDGIDDEKARIFIENLDFIRKKFGAKYGTISLSTHYRDSRVIKKIQTILSRNLSKDIKIGTNFFLGGIYDFASDTEITVNPNFNLDKVRTFMNNYVNTLETENVWFALIDDNIPDDTFSRCDNRHSMLIARPSSNQSDLKKNTFVRIASTTRGFDGVLEIFASYLESIENLSLDEIKETQKKSMVHLSSYELATKITNREYSFLKRYFEEGYADADDYIDALDWLLMVNRDRIIGEEELSELSNILHIIIAHFRRIGLKAQEERTIAFQNTLTHKN